MRKRSLGPAWKVTLATVALVATAMAFYVQLFERRSRQEEDRLAAVRLERALEQSRARLKAEILAQLREDFARGGAAEEDGDQPLPNAVLRRGESGGAALQQVLESQESQVAFLEGSFEDLARQMERSDQALRQDLEELRAEIRREQGTAGKALTLLLVALIPLVLHLLSNLWPSGDGKRDTEDKTG
jgi:hypothetical protein